MSQTNPADQTAGEICAAIAAGELSSRDALEAHLERVEARNGPINAVVALDVEGARARADEADAAHARGEQWGVFHGLPMTIKDSYEVPGMPTTSGAPEFANHMAASNAVAVQRLVDAGAIVFGKTNLPLY
ncbi:MAG: amidase family protein, partial [Myxococcota bacterium]